MSSSKLARVAALMRHCRNWPDIIIARLRGKRPNQIVLRKTGPISSTADTDLWNHFSDIWLHESYGDPSFLRDSVVFDCGANVGLFSLYALASGARKVVSIEPATHVVETLVTNTGPYRDRCDVVSAAVSDEPGSKWFRRAAESTASSLVDSPVDGDEQIDIITLPMLLDRFGDGRQQIFVKIDCEGEEGAILSGAGSRLREITYLALEYHSISSRDRCQNILASAGCFRHREWPRDRGYGMIFAQNVSESRS